MAGDHLSSPVQGLWKRINRFCIQLAAGDPHGWAQRRWQWSENISLRRTGLGAQRKEAKCILSAGEMQSPISLLSFLHTDSSSRAVPVQSDHQWFPGIHSFGMCSSLSALSTAPLQLGQAPERSRAGGGRGNIPPGPPDITSPAAPSGVMECRFPAGF